MLHSHAPKDNSVLTINEGCPWYKAQHSYGVPKTELCEPMTCSYIVYPANTWSNLSFIFVALIFLKKMSEPLVRLFAINVFMMGALSATYHATNNDLTEYLDFVGLCLMMSFLLAFNLLRVIGKNPRNIASMFWFLFSLNNILFVCFKIMSIPAQELMLFNAIPIIAFDIIAGGKERRFHEYKYFLLGILSIGIAQSSAVIELRRIWCEPDNIFLHGHVLSHIFTALAMLFAGLHINRMLRYRME